MTSLLELFALRTKVFDEFIEKSKQRKAQEFNVEAIHKIKSPKVTPVGLLADWEFSTKFLAKASIPLAKAPVALVKYEDSFVISEETDSRMAGMCKFYYERVNHYFEKIEENFPESRIIFRDLTKSGYVINL